MASVMKWIAGHRKFLVALAGAVVTVAVNTYGTSNHWVELLLLLAAAAGVHGVRNGPKPPAK